MLVDRASESRTLAMRYRREDYVHYQVSSSVRVCTIHSEIQKLKSVCVEFGPGSYVVNYGATCVPGLLCAGSTLHTT